MALCARCNGEHATKQCSLPFLRTKTRQEERDAEHAAFLVREARRKEKAEREEAEHDAFLAREERRKDEHEAFLAREKRRNEKADRRDKEVERLLANESKFRLRIAKEAEERDITRAEELEHAMIDGAGIEWWKDRQSGWWWWRAAEGEWQSTGRRYTPVSTKAVQKVSVCTKAVENVSARRPSDASETASVMSQSSASTAASATLSLDTRSRRTEKKLRDVSVLEAAKCGVMTSPLTAQVLTPAPAPAPSPAPSPTPAWILQQLG